MPSLNDMTITVLFACGCFMLLAVPAAIILFFMLVWPKKASATSTLPRRATSAQRNVRQIQCPQCGGYDIELTDKPFLLELMTWMGYLFFIIPGLIFTAMMRSEYDRRWQLFWNGMNTATCKLCRREFWANEVPVTPIQSDSELIRISRQRLNEEEERRRRYYDD